MLTVIETAEFVKQADAVWTEQERLDFFAWLCLNPEAGDVFRVLAARARCAGR
ncbi:hypothetical protein [Ottowia sp.]|jgi:hypothetical protein|uniref:hypothetical protein n=1 Tax=Ottowia sp. TaxID=1898956 RepID=UPI0025EFFC37|nr:hypothetical protein [Ottowia sp.]